MSEEHKSLWRTLFRRPSNAEMPQQLSGGPGGATQASLGRELFQDPRLSGNGDRSCASCHNLARDFTDGLKLARARNGGSLERHTPTLWNIAFADRFNWDGSASTLAAQAIKPITDAREMAGTLVIAVQRLSSDVSLRQRFRAAFALHSTGVGDDERLRKGAASLDPDITAERILAALVAYERTLISPPTRFDAWVGGDDAALTKQELAGFSIFVGKGRCATCHAGWRFTDDRLHDIGLKERREAGGGSSRREFKTPTLREVMHTAPYMHDGSLATLDAVLRHYAGEHVRRPSLAPNLNTALRLNPAERASVIAFLRVLSHEKDNRKK